MSREDRNQDVAHEKVRAQLDDYVDGTLPETERHVVENHVVACAGCRDEVAALRALIDAARALPAEMAPREDSWPDLEKRIRQRPVVVAGTQTSHPTVPVRRDSASWMRGGVAAAAGFVFVVAVAWMATRDPDTGRSRDDARRADVEVTALDAAFAVMPAVVRGLEIECMGAGQILQASLIADDVQRESIASSMRTGLETLDLSIAETRAALEEHPDDSLLVRRLTMRYQQKLDLLLGAIRLAEDV